MSAALAAPGDPALTARRQRFAAGHSWNDRAARIAKLLGVDHDALARPGTARAGEPADADGGPDARETPAAQWSQPPVRGQ
ncbi:hypothetical protein I6A84_42120 [Frankia sp. CNm7]|uniref:hypothetical protein n=1 Tax=Frankia nepalensis TaxID=1836974 RepID=UPI001933E589|nr:hypothetical protein [Frankia nepalensis]MBL7524462.1 hypothetical protein [Frankia nepalensis]